jgi:hypothetical protein
MRASLRVRFWIEAALAASSASMFAVTVTWRDWIEAVFHVDPDRHSGSLEWAIVAALCALTVACGLLARSEWRNRVEVAG